MKKSVKIDYEYEHLLCPRCGDGYLHHARLVVYDRREDGPEVTVTTIDNGEARRGTIDNKRSGNPSARRDGLYVEFWCEACGDGLRLNVAQHKGQTDLFWTIAPPSLDNRLGPPLVERGAA